MTNPSTPLSFEQWYERHAEKLDTQFAENGTDRECDFDREEALAQAYENYLIHFEETK